MSGTRRKSSTTSRVSRSCCVPRTSPPGRRAAAVTSARRASGESIGVINVMGRIFMQPLDDPFAIVLKEIEAMRAKARVIIVDFHAEATSEKVAMGWHLDGRVTGGLRHAHPRPDGRRAHPAERHRLPHRRRDDRPARLDHRRHDRDRAREFRDRPARALRIGQRPGPPERRHRHRGPGDRARDRDRAAQPVGDGSRGARAAAPAEHYG